MRAILPLLFALVACETVEFETVAAPDGDDMVEATCYDSMRDCMNGARKYCKKRSGGKYEVVSQDKGNTDFVALPSGGSTILASSTTMHMYFRCVED